MPITVLKWRLDTSSDDDEVTCSGTLFQAKLRQQEKHVVIVNKMMMTTSNADGDESQSPRSEQLSTVSYRPVTPMTHLPEIGDKDGTMKKMPVSDASYM